MKNLLDNVIDFVKSDDKVAALLLAMVLTIFTAIIAVFWMLLALLSFATSELVFWVGVVAVVSFFYGITSSYIEDQSPTNDAEDDNG